MLAALSRTLLIKQISTRIFFSTLNSVADPKRLDLDPDPAPAKK